MNFAEVTRKLEKKKVVLSVCMPHDQETIAALDVAQQLGYIDCRCVGDPDLIKELCGKYAPGFLPECIRAETPELAAEKSVGLVRDGTAAALMKGSISTPILLKAVLNSETGIKLSAVLSHALVFEWKDRFMFLTDGGMVPHPTLEEKQEIIKNCVRTAISLGIEKPRVAVLSAVEKVNLKLQSTVDAAILSKMGERHQLGDCIVEGPLALDNAISLESAHHKGLFNDVVGRADILVAPDIDTGNVLGKTILYYSKAQAGGLIIGANAPIILLSRSDDKDTRLNSIKLALAAGG